jgi:hypothetical protein
MLQIVLVRATNDDGVAARAVFHGVEID